MAIRLETERLILRRPARGDAEALVKAIGSRQIAATTLNIPYPYTIDNAHQWIDKVSDPETHMEVVDLSVFLKDSGELVGGIGLSGISSRHRRAELGYWCTFEHWGKGITTEAARRLVGYGFVDLGLERIYAVCFITNPASARVMQKIGMLFEGTARHEFMKDGEFIDFHHYAILRSDWEKSGE